MDAAASGSRKEQQGPSDLQPVFQAIYGHALYQTQSRETNHIEASTPLNSKGLQNSGWEPASPRLGRLLQY